MPKQNLSKMMEQRSPLVEREVVEEVELYTSVQNITPIRKKKPVDEIPQAANMNELLKKNEIIKKRGIVVNYAFHRTTEEDVTKYTTHLAPLLIKAIKRLALESDLRDYEVVQAALIEYLNEHDAL